MRRRGRHFALLTLLALVPARLCFAATANAGPDQVVPPGATVTLDASRSQPTNGGTLSFQWRQTKGTPVTLADPTSAVTTFVAPSATSRQTLQFQVTVAETASGGDGEERQPRASRDSVNITVLPPNTSPGAPTADAGGDQSAAPGGTVTLDGSHSSNPGPGTLTYHWDQIDGPSVRLQNADSAVASFVVPAGVSSSTEFQFRLTVSNASGSATDVASVKVSASAEAPVTPPQAPPQPSASISNLSIYPDPFTPHDGAVNIEYDLGADCDVTIRIYDMFGEGVRVLTARGGEPGGAAGRTRVAWDGRNGRGDLVGNGGYVLEIEATDAAGKTVRAHGRLAVVK